MSETNDQPNSAGSFIVGVWDTDDPPTEIVVHGAKKWPGWPFLTDKRDLYMLCAFNITTSDMVPAGKVFIDVASSVSNKIGCFCNTAVIVEPQSGSVACTLEITRSLREVGSGERIPGTTLADATRRRGIGHALAAEMALALEAQGYRNLNRIPLQST